MRLFQTGRDYVAQEILVRDVPVLAPIVRRRLVALHVDAYRRFAERDVDTPRS